MEKIKCVISENGTIIPIHNIAVISAKNASHYIWSNADADDSNCGHKLSEGQYDALLGELEFITDKYNIRGIKSKHAEGKLGEMIKEMKSVDKVEPKFHEGEWIIRSAEGFKHNTYLVKEVKDYYACEDLKGQRVTFTLNDVHKNFKLWHISDAKDGDVLAVESENDYPSPFITIYKERGLDFFNSHCFVAFDGKFYVGENGHSTEDIHPATKEQRNTLEKAMADAGYEWNAEKKELKKIVDKEQIKKNLQDNSFRRMLEKKLAEWSEDDERLFQIVIDILDRQNHLGNISRTDLIACVRKLKSLRPQNVCSYNPYKATVESIAEMCKRYDVASHSGLRDFYNNVRVKCKDAAEYNEKYPQSQWKPTEEQMKALNDINLTGNISYAGQGQELINLYNDLKKLKC